MSVSATKKAKKKAATAVTSTRPRFRCKGPRIKEDGIERKGCGASLDELINKVKPDGKDHGIECPNCGNVSSVRKTPVEEVEATAAEG